MTCREHDFYKQKKDLTRVEVLANQYASITGVTQAIVLRYSGIYGKYYEVISQYEADQRGEHVLQLCRPLPAVKVSAGRKPGKSRTANYKGKPAGD